MYTMGFTTAKGPMAYGIVTLQAAPRASVAGNIVLACFVFASCGGSGSPTDASTPEASTPEASTPEASTAAPEASASEVELWYGGTSLCAFTQGQLQTSASTTPGIVVSTSLVTAVSDVALDASGNVWVVGSGSDNVFRFPAGSVLTSGSAQPDLVIQSAALDNPGNLVFDAAGSLWVANRPSSDSGTPDGSVVRFDISSGMSGTQNVTPVTRITSPTPGDLFEIGNIAFDGAQNLWVTSFVGLLRFDKPRGQSGDVALAPSAVIEKDGYANDLYFYSIAFDANGDLWAASGDGLHHLTSVSEFQNVKSFYGRSSPAAAATITGGTDVLPAGGLAFDGNQNLWMATAQAILMYSGPGELIGTTNPVPAITLNVVGPAEPTTNTHLAFFPSPTGSIAVTDAAANDE
jgi:ligand-binding sensor domain-containing protein